MQDVALGDALDASNEPALGPWGQRLLWITKAFAVAGGIGFIVLVLNTAAIMAMLRHYREDRDFMYGLDIKFLDEARAAKR